MTTLAPFTPPVWTLTGNGTLPQQVTTDELVGQLSTNAWWPGPIGTRVETALELGMPALANELLAPHGIHVRRAHA